MVGIGRGGLGRRLSLSWRLRGVTRRLRGLAGPHRLAGKVPSTGRWDVYRRQRIGELRLEAGVQKIAFKPNGQFETALMDLRELRLTPRPADKPAPK